jgi:PAS domain S-box-containing protein
MENGNDRQTNKTRIKLYTAVISFAARRFFVFSFKLWVHGQITEDALISHDERYRTLIQTAMDGFWIVDRQGNLLTVNAAYCQMSGYSEQELLTMSIYDLESSETAEETAAHIQQIILKGQDRFTSKHLRKDGDIFDVEVSTQYRQDDGGQFVCFLRDITDLKRIEEQLSQEQAFLRCVIDSAEDLIYFKDCNSTYIGCNKASEGFTGITERDQKGKTDFDFFDREVAERIVEDDQKVIESHTSVRTEEWAPSPAFGKVLLETVKTPIYGSDGQALGLVGISREMTERKRIEEKLIRSQQLLTEVGKVSKVGGWELNIDTEFLQWTEEVYHILEVDLDYVPTVETALDFYSDASRTVIADALQRASEHNEPFDLELEIITSKGALRHVHALGVTDLEHRRVYGILQDITERMQVEKKLAASLEVLAKTESLGKVGGWEFNIDTGKQTWSKGVYDIHEIGYEYNPTVSTGIDFYTQESRSIIAKAVKQAVEQGEPFDLELEIRTAKGNLRKVHAIGNADLENRRIQGFFQDISERKSNEVALLAATQATEAASRAKGLFLAKMSHELRTPMTAIIGFGELLEEADLTPEHKRYLAAINTSGNTLSSLIDDVLALSKVDAGELAVKQKEFRLRTFLTKLVATQEQQMAKKNLSFSISIDGDVPDSLTGDPQRIQQVLLNLLGNAIKFTEKGDIGIAVSVAEESNFRVLLNFAVRDTGIGISADKLGYIFEPFAQALGSSHDNYSGSGLGLTISRSLAGLMGGTVSVESQEGIGSTFCLLLPLLKMNDSLSDKPLPQREVSLWCGPPLNILLAEDNPINSHFIKTVLKGMGHAVSHAENGKVALNALKVNSFDLVLMDIQMPVMNGVDVLSVIREMEQLSGKHLNVIALTAFALIGDKENYLSMGFDGYLSKPFKTKELMDEILQVLSR